MPKITDKFEKMTCETANVEIQGFVTMKSQ